MSYTNESFEKSRLSYLRKRILLIFLSFTLALIVALILLFLSKDLVLALCGGILFAYATFKLFNSKLEHEKASLENFLLEDFLKAHHASFEAKGISEASFKQLFDFDLAHFHSLNSFYFKDFSLSDVLFITQDRQKFSGILILAKKDFTNATKNDKAIFTKLKSKYFNTNSHFMKAKACLIQTRVNPFFIYLRLNLEQNKTLLKNNLKQIEKLLSA